MHQGVQASVQEKNLPHGEHTLAKSITTAQRIADALLRTQGTTLEIELLDARDRGESFERIARNLAARTDGAIDVASGTVRNWHSLYATSDAA